MLNLNRILQRSEAPFEQDLEIHAKQLEEAVTNSRILVVGAAGSIGSAVVRELFKRAPAALHAVDISENNLAELVRDVRSSSASVIREFLALPLDSESAEFAAFADAQKSYDYVLNFSALKHVRSEKDPFSLMRMTRVNILNTIALHELAEKKKAAKYFAVSTDKAAAPVNLMGASKRIMELALFSGRIKVPVSTARFANVAFSDGSLLASFIRRFEKGQPMAGPSDVKRYFVTDSDAGILCLFSLITGGANEVYFPKLELLKPISFPEIAEEFLAQKGFKMMLCHSETEAREQTSQIKDKKWPAYFSPSDTTGEKDLEEFYTADEKPDFDRFLSLGVLKAPESDDSGLDVFRRNLEKMRSAGRWTKEDIVAEFRQILPDLTYEDKGKYLDAKM